MFELRIAYFSLCLIHARESIKILDMCTFINRASCLPFGCFVCTVIHMFCDELFFWVVAVASLMSWPYCAEK